jgi:hypothetical protein
MASVPTSTPSSFSSYVLVQWPDESDMFQLAFKRTVYVFDGPDELIRVKVKGPLAATLEGRDSVTVSELVDILDNRDDLVEWSFDTMTIDIVSLPFMPNYAFIVGESELDITPGVVEFRGSSILSGKIDIIGRPLGEHHL